MSSLLSNSLIFALGLALLALGATYLTKVASKISRGLKISPLVIGATVVALGTSLPELAVTVVSFFKGQNAILIGNILGSNIGNLGLILGLSILLMPVRVGTEKTQRNNLIFLFTAIAFIGAQFVPLSYRKLVSTVLLISFALFMLIEIYWGERGALKEDLKLFKSKRERHLHLAKNFVLLTGLIGLIVLSSRLVVSAAVEMSKILNFSEEVVALSFVAIGTSLPELSVSIAAAIKKQEKLLLGDIVGSNIINISLLGFVATLVSPLTSREHYFSLLTLGVFTLLTFVFIKIYRGRPLPKMLGVFFLLLYGLYIYLIY